MDRAQRMVNVYREIAERYDRLGRTQLRDRFLALAADSALSAGQNAEAELVRVSLLHMNPHHLLKPFASFAEAMRSPDVRDYVADLRRRHPHSAAEPLLESLRSESADPAPSESLTQTISVRKLKHAAGNVTAPFDEPLKTSHATQGADAKSVKSAKLDPVAAPAPVGPMAPPGPVVLPGPIVTPAPTPARPQPPAFFPLRPSTPPREHVARDTDTGPGSWVGTVFFVLVLAAGMLLTLYSLVRPFLPPEWNL